MTYRNITCIQNKIEVLQQIALRQKKKKRKSKNEKKIQIIHWDKTKENHFQRCKINPS